jgi:hypothetical protein
LKCVCFNPQSPTVFHTPVSFLIIFDTCFIILLYLRLINKFPMFLRTSLIDISCDTNIAQGGSRLKLTNKTKIDCSQNYFCKLIN